MLGRERARLCGTLLRRASEFESEACRVRDGRRALPLTTAESATTQDFPPVNGAVPRLDAGSLRLHCNLILVVPRVLLRRDCPSSSVVARVVA